MDYNKILRFWFSELTDEDWWKKSNDLDALIRRRFEKIHDKAAKGELFEWRATAAGSLAEIIILDQFSRNIYRNTPKAFSSDGMALALAQRSVELNFDKQLPISQLSFLYLPFMHSESLEIHTQAMHLFSKKGLEEHFEFEKKHRAILLRFGRYPHRNEILGRPSTKEETFFLTQPNSSF